jgi:DNA-binding transcriptional ArsR family regulator
MSDTPDAFAALASPVRRQLLMALRAGPRSASELASGMAIGRPAVSEHLQALRLAGLTRVERRGRERYYYLDPRPLADVGAWLNAMLVNWTRRLNDLNGIGEDDRRR